MITRPILPLAVLAAAALVSCSGDGGLSPAVVPDAETATALAEPRGCPTSGPGAYGDIDWVDFIQLDGITYSRLGVYAEAPGPPEVGEQIGEVRCRLSGNAGVHYKSKDGDAAFLDPRTPIYSLKAYAPSFRVAAESPTVGGFAVYEASTNPEAETGGDILDIRGKVTLFRLRGTPAGLSGSTDVRDADEIAAIIGMVLDSPVDHVDREHLELDQHRVEFHLEDGTIVVRAYWPETGELSRGIILPAEFRRLIPQDPE